MLTELNREFVFAVCRVTLISTLKITSRTYFLRRISFENDVLVCIKKANKICTLLSSDLLALIVFSV